MARPEALEPELVRRLAGRLVGAFEVERVILFGSYARGDFHEGSDVDVCVIARTRETFLDRLVRAKRAVAPVLPEAEVVVYTPEELERMQRAGNGFVDSIMREGRTLYERQST